MPPDNSPVYPPGYWRDAGRRLNVFGIPGSLFLLYLFWFRFPCLDTLYIVSGILAAFRLLAAFGWTLSVLMSRMARLMRGRQLSGRPWWYRRFTSGE